MSLTRLQEENEQGPELRRIYEDIRSSFDLPFVPSIFKLAAGIPEYLRLMWNDLGPVARSREFQAASHALEEFVRSQVISAGWRLSDQRRVLAGQKFSYNDIEHFGAIVTTLVRAAVRMTLFARLIQLGYSGGQKGRVSPGAQTSALSRIMTLHVPNESQAGLRVWLIYSDIRRTLGTRNVLSVYRILSPFPAYLASVWMDSKKLLSDPSLMRARDEVARRASGLVIGIPVKDHRAAGKNITPAQWREIEEMVDSFAKLQPQFTLICAAWQRSFPQFVGQLVAA